MRRLYLALLWLFAVGFSSASFADPICSVGSTDLGPAATSAECKTLFLAHIDHYLNNIASGPRTLYTSSDDEYYCPSGGFSLFPCGARWDRWYAYPNTNVIDAIFTGYWQGISRNITLTLARDPLEGGGSESSTILKSVEPGSGPGYLRIIATDDNTGLTILPPIVNITAGVIANSGGHQHDNNCKPPLKSVHS